ncbi:2-dehydropantoate 2-reductase [Microbacterium sp. ISL-103]|uniref:ketopantoate reductase family protein n=1 Tax=Microbacterium sp. ISL-103 TaxID=2819156 RepID=UPI001BEA79DB|nr:2-dehydropantoate 2-reductase [Microbacterium sp. ISL-103]MBT2473730.1 2-dehydropantoate 2-reductase [Microbacterium sp. ISL-103]
MRICVFGAGAVGGHIAGRLGAVGQHVSVIARGEQLEAIRGRGLRVETRDGVLESTPYATARPEELPSQHVVIVAVKAQSLPQIAAPLSRLLDDDTRVIFATNGIPWWYFHGLRGPYAEERLPLLDPTGALRDLVRPERAVGAVAYTAGTLLAPGVVRAENPKNRLVIGRPDGQPDARLDEFAALLRPSGLEVTVDSRIRDAVWTKLVSNAIGGSLGALTASAGRDILDKPALSAFATAMGHEVVSIARKLGSNPGDPKPILEKLAASTHLQSIAQDLLAERPMEIDALLRAPLALAEIADVPVPHLQFIFELLAQRARAAGAYRESLDI